MMRYKIQENVTTNTEVIDTMNILKDRKSP